MDRLTGEEITKALQWVASNDELVFNAEIARDAADHIEAITVERDVYKRDFGAARERAEKAEAVVPVRCGECTKWREETGWCDELSTFIDRDGRPCGPSESSNWRVFQSNDYCSYGERRENHA